MRKLMWIVIVVAVVTGLVPCGFASSDPDQPIRAHDILFVPDSTAKNLFNRTIESAIQSAAGVSIYAGMVYSQRF